MRAYRGGECLRQRPAGIRAGFVLDEHLLSGGSHDRNYKGGGEMRLSGGRSGLLASAMRETRHSLTFSEHEYCESLLSQSRCRAEAAD